MLRTFSRRAASSSSFFTSNSWVSISGQILPPRRREFCLGVLPDGVDRSSDAFARNSEAMGGFITELRSHINKVYHYSFGNGLCVLSIGISVDLWVIMCLAGSSWGRAESCEEK